MVVDGKHQVGPYSDCQLRSAHNLRCETAKQWGRDSAICNPTDGGDITLEIPQSGEYG